MEGIKTEVGAITDNAKANGFWTPDREGVLRKGLPEEANAKGEAIDKMRALHPKLKKLNTIEKRLDGVAPSGLAIWMTAEFWKKEIDLALIEGIYSGKQKRPQAIERIRAVWPELEGEALRKRMEKLASDSQPEWFQKSFWESLDPILLAGLKQGKIEERQAIDKVLRLHPELRIERVWARIRDLRRRNRKAIQPQAGPFPWTEEQEHSLLALCGEVGLKECVSRFQRETGWPRDAIIRKAHKLGLPKKEYQRKQEWSEIDRTFLLVSVRHVPVKRIARQLGRPEKAVWVQIWREGLPAACEEGYSRRELCRKFHVSSATLRGWIHAEWLKDGADRRIPERSVRELLRQHPDLVDWGRLDSEARQWALELSAKEEGASREEVVESNGSRVRPSCPKQLAATGQTQEALEDAGASNLHRTEPSRR
jgi:hypothetical protein